MGLHSTPSGDAPAPLPSDGGSRPGRRAALAAWISLAAFPLCGLAFVALVPTLGMQAPQNTWAPWQFALVPLLLLLPLVVAFLFGVTAGLRGAKRGWLAAGIAFAIGGFGIWMASVSDSRCPSTYRDCADVRLAVSAPPNVGPGDQVALSVTVSNRGPLTAEALELVAELPAGVELLSKDLAPDSATLAIEIIGSTVRARTDSLPVDGHATLRIAAHVRSDAHDSLVFGAYATTRTPLAWPPDADPRSGAPVSASSMVWMEVKPD